MKNVSHKIHRTVIFSNAISLYPLEDVYTEGECIQRLGTTMFVE